MYLNTTLTVCSAIFSAFCSPRIAGPETLYFHLIFGKAISLESTLELEFVELQFEAAYSPVYPSLSLSYIFFTRQLAYSLELWACIPVKF